MVILLLCKVSQSRDETQHGNRLLLNQTTVAPNLEWMTVLQVCHNPHKSSYLKKKKWNWIPYDHIRSNISKCTSGSISGSCSTSKRGERALETTIKCAAEELQLCNDTGQHQYHIFSLEKLRACVSNLLVRI